MPINELGNGSIKLLFEWAQICSQPARSWEIWTRRIRDTQNQHDMCFMVWNGSKISPVVSQLCKLLIQKIRK